MKPYYLWIITGLCAGLGVAIAEESESGSLGGQAQALTVTVNINASGDLPAIMYWTDIKFTQNTASRSIFLRKEIKMLRN